MRKFLHGTGRTPLRLCIALLACLPMPSIAQESVADTEIRALISRLGDSRCRFQRNGRWYDAAAAQAHLQRKYDWARKRGLSGDAGTFIAQAASRSSFSGRAYLVDCPGQAPVEAAPWFAARLAELRMSTPPR